MLTSNFRALISFQNKHPVKNVLGETQTKEDVFMSQRGNGKTPPNNHSNTGIVGYLDYSSTPNSNVYTQEQTTYTWANIVNNYNSETTQNQGRTSGLTLFVGTGNTPATSEDYKLESAIELEVTGASCEHSTNEKTYITRTFKNQTEAPVTITELGVYVFTSHENNRDTTTDSKVFPIIMVGRQVLNEPVEIQPGDIYTFTYVIDFSGIDISQADQIVQSLKQ